MLQSSLYAAFLRSKWLAKRHPSVMVGLIGLALDRTYVFIHSSFSPLLLTGLQGWVSACLWSLSVRLHHSQAQLCFLANLRRSHMWALEAPFPLWWCVCLFWCLPGITVILAHVFTGGQTSWPWWLHFILCCSAHLAVVRPETTCGVGITDRIIAKLKQQSCWDPV